MDGLAFAICAATITAAVGTVYIYRANLKVDWTKFEDVVAERGDLDLAPARRNAAL